MNGGARGAGEGINKADARVIAIEGRNGEGILRIARPASRTNVLLKSNPLSRRSFELLQKAIVVQLFLSASDPLTRDSIVLSGRGRKGIVKKARSFYTVQLFLCTWDHLVLRARRVSASRFSRVLGNIERCLEAILWSIVFSGIVLILCTLKSSTAWKIMKIGFYYNRNK